MWLSTEGDQRFDAGRCTTIHIGGAQLTVIGQHPLHLPLFCGPVLELFDHRHQLLVAPPAGSLSLRRSGISSSFTSIILRSACSGGGRIWKACKTAVERRIPFCKRVIRGAGTVLRIGLWLLALRVTRLRSLRCLVLLDLRLTRPHVATSLHARLEQRHVGSHVGGRGSRDIARLRVPAPFSAVGRRAERVARDVAATVVGRATAVHVRCAHLHLRSAHASRAGARLSGGASEAYGPRIAPIP